MSKECELHFDDITVNIHNSLIEQYSMNNSDLLFTQVIEVRT